MTIERRIALLGQPNSGKSTVFNALTGAHQHVGNWPGKTVERKEGQFKHNDVNYTVIDLPGTYSLSANSDEEMITRDCIASGSINLVCILADASQLERSLFMLADYAGIKIPAMLVVTMVDVAEAQGKQVDIMKLEKALNIPVVGLIAPERKNYGEFYAKLEESFENPRSVDSSRLQALLQSSDVNGDYKKALSLVSKVRAGKFSDHWLASKLVEGDVLAARMVDSLSGDNAGMDFSLNACDGSLYTSECKFRWIEELLSDAVTRKKSVSEVLTRFDRLAISRRWGKLIALGIIILGIAASMIVAMPIMGIALSLPKAVGPLVLRLADIGVPSWLAAFLNDVLVNALSWVISMVGFVFGVNFVFGLIEDVGYMARISYSFDNTMSKLGLQGKSIMPMIIGLGCTIGGAAGTRVIDSWGQKILTIALVWAVPCGATFAVIPTLANAFFGWGSILVMVLLFLIMFVHIIITAKIFGRKLSPVAERTGIIMELPPYHKPHWKALFRTTLDRVWGVFRKAFVVVMVVAALFWLLAYSSDGDASRTALYKIGTAIEPVTRFLGMRWQAFIAFLSSMVSKEAVLGVTSVLFAGGGTIFSATARSTAADSGIGAILAAAMTKPEALAFIVAVTFNVPCLMALSSTYQESHSLKWTIRIALYYIFTALLLSCIVFHLSKLFF